MELTAQYTTKNKKGKKLIDNYKALSHPGQNLIIYVYTHTLKYIKRGMSIINTKNVFFSQENHEKTVREFTIV